VSWQPADISGSCAGTRASLSACLPNVLASGRWFRHKLARAPDRQDSGYAFLGPCWVRKPSPAWAPAIPARTREPRGQSAFGVKQQTAKAQDRNKAVQIGLVLDFSVRIPAIVLDRKPGQDNMAKMMTKSELIQKITDQHSDLTKKDVKAVMETLATVAYKELKKTGAFLLPGFAKFVVIKKPATKERAGINPFTKEPTVFKARPARKIIRARPVKAAKDAV
jgi:DNA-binding protein HU-beta